MMRHHFALARLIALVMEKCGTGSQPVRLPAGVDRVILANDRHQRPRHAVGKRADQRRCAKAAGLLVVREGKMQRHLERPAEC